MHKTTPIVGNWYKRPGRPLFEVVAIDEHSRTVALQFYDGTVDELDREAWDTAYVMHRAPPEDYSGSMDLQDNVYAEKTDDLITETWDDPITFLEQADA